MVLDFTVNDWDGRFKCLLLLQLLPFNFLIAIKHYYFKVQKGDFKTSWLLLGITFVLRATLGRRPHSCFTGASAVLRGAPWRKLSLHISMEVSSFLYTIDSDRENHEWQYSSQNMQHHATPQPLAKSTLSHTSPAGVKRVWITKQISCPTIPPRASFLLILRVWVMLCLVQVQGLVLILRITGLLKEMFRYHHAAAQVQTGQRLLCRNNRLPPTQKDSLVFSPKLWREIGMENHSF